MVMKATQVAPLSPEGGVAAYVAVSVGARNVSLTQKALALKPEVKLVHALVGHKDYDLLAFVEVTTMGSLVELIDREIAALKANALIERTITMLVLQDGGFSYVTHRKSPLGKLAWIFIQTGGRSDAEVVEDLLRVAQVVNAHSVLGEWDVVALVECHDDSEMAAILDNRIRPIAGVRYTATLQVLQIPDYVTTT